MGNSRCPSTQEIQATCMACGLGVTVRLLINVELSEAIAYMDTIKCPLCGASFENLCL